MTPDPTLLEGTGTTGTGTFIANYDLQDYIPVPVAGEEPVKKIDQEDMVIAVVWKDKDEKNIPNISTFAPDTVYRATITLTAKDGFSFDPAKSFEYPDEAVAEQQENGAAVSKRVLVITYNPTEGSINTGDDLSPYIPAPVGGAIPAASFFAGSYGGTIVWETGGVPMTGAFQANTAYTAKATLSAMSGYTLAGKTLTCTEGTLNSSAEWNNNGLTITRIRIDFPASSGTPTVPLDPDLTYKIPAPGMGGTPVTWFSTPRYTGNVVWTLNTGGPHSGLFAAYEAYTATVTLTAASGYSLTGGTFTHMRGTLNGANEWSNTGSTITGMRIAFPVTGNVPPVPVTNVDLTSKISAPVAGGTPVTYFSTVQFTGNVDWACTGDAGWTSNMTFQAGRAYTATVTLTAASGYTLDGVGADDFICIGASSVTYIAGSPMVFIAFPAASSTPLGPVADLDLTSKVNVPAAGGTPGTNFTGSQYTGNVTWTCPDDTGWNPNTVFQVGRRRTGPRSR